MNNFNRDEGLIALTEAILNGFSADSEMKKAIEEVQKSDVFFSNIIASMKIYSSNRGRTMSTNGKDLEYNPAFVEELIQMTGMNESVQAIIVHEILHIAFGHHIAFAKELDEAKRTNNKNLKWLVNVACDLAINTFLYDRKGFPKFKNLYVPGYSPQEEPFVSFPKEKDARWYYNQLKDYYKNKPQDEQPQDQDSGDDPDQQDDSGEQGQGGGGQGQPDDSNEQGEENSQGGGQGASEGEEESGDEQGSQGGGEGTAEGDQEGQGSGQGGPEQAKGSGGSEGDSEGSEGGSSVGEGGDEEGDSAGASSEGSGGGEGSGSSKSEGEEASEMNIPDELIDSYKGTGEIEAHPDADGDQIDNQKQQHDQDMKQIQKDAEKLNDIKQQRGIGGSGGAYSNINYAKFIKDQNKIPWNQIINEFLTENERGETTYRRPSRRSSGMSFSDFYADRDEEIIMPSRYEEKLNELMLIVDVSGSNQRAANGVFPEIKGAINSSGFGNQSALRLVSFNTRVEDEYIFSFNPKDYVSLKNPNEKLADENVIIPQGNDLLSGSEMDNFNWRVGGGTRIGPVFDALSQLREQPPFIVILTDGEFTYSERQMLEKGNFQFKIIWIMTLDNGIEYQGHRTYKLYEMDYTV